ncbi:hypothetical protein D3C87_687240 [compost metagenome]
MKFKDIPPGFRFHLEHDLPDAPDRVKIDGTRMMYVDVVGNTSGPVERMYANTLVKPRPMQAARPTLTSRAVTAYIGHVQRSAAKRGFVALDESTPMTRPVGKGTARVDVTSEGRTLVTQPANLRAGGAA